MKKRLLLLFVLFAILNTSARAADVLFATIATLTSLNRANNQLQTIELSDKCALMTVDCYNDQLRFEDLLKVKQKLNPGLNYFVYALS